MTEEENKEETQEKPKEAAANPSAVSVLEKATAAAERLEEANKKMEANIARMETIQAQNLLAGRADAGTNPEAKKETAAEYAAKVMANDAKTSE